MSGKKGKGKVDTKPKSGKAETKAEAKSTEAKKAKKTVPTPAPKETITTTTTTPAKTEAKKAKKQAEEPEEETADSDEKDAEPKKIMDNESESDKEMEYPNRAPKLDPYGPVSNKEEERSRVEVKPSKIPGAGNGVFALYDFAKGDVVTEFLGKKCPTREDAYNGMMYAVEFTGDSGELILLDGWGYDNAAALANDALGRTRMPFLRNNARFTHYGDRMFLCAKRNIKKGDEIFVQYGHEYWQMEEDEYFEVNTTSEIIEKKLDTCH